MYKTATKLTNPLAAAVVSLSLLTSAAAVAGPGKPGVNDLAPGGNIVEVATAANAALGVFNTVLAAATCDYFEGAVVDILTGEDKVTLFAPTDDAFAVLELDETNICGAFNTGEVDAPTPDDLLTILAYHVTDGRRFSNSVFNRNNAKEIEMLAGGSIFTAPDFSISDNQVRGDGPDQLPPIGLVTPYININASNGVIHVINAVMLP
jgi:uncharacterized surface protein with fasciclin (FAS1) repeats